MHLRRYYTVLAAAARLEAKRATAGAALAMRAEITGRALPSDFPFRDALLAVGYPCVEDLGDPASDPLPDDARSALRDELVAAGLVPSAARAVVAAL